jgi:predicted dehydrogenase
MRLGISGYGAVAAVHAKGLRRWGAAPVVVCGPNMEKARTFAQQHEIPHAVTGLDSTFETCDAVIVASPSECHFAQGLAALRARRHCLLELPACSSAAEARELWRAATEAGVMVQCAHTSRYLPAMIRLEAGVRAGALGDIRHVVSLRAIPPRTRSWVDDAVLHHAAHHVDLLQHWFGSVRPLACATHPSPQRSQDAALLGSLPNGAPVNVSVSYTSRLRETRLTMSGSVHTVSTDGFSFVESDSAAFAWRGDEQESYEAAVEFQDRSFVDACRGEAGGIPWQETIRLAECLDSFLQRGE